MDKGQLKGCQPDDLVLSKCVAEKNGRGVISIVHHVVMALNELQRALFVSRGTGIDQWYSQFITCRIKHAT